jgi:hypothetical protein
MHPDQLYIIITAQQQAEQRQAEHSRLIREIQRNAMEPSVLQILGRLGSVLRSHWRKQTRETGMPPPEGSHQSAATPCVSAKAEATTRYPVDLRSK